MPFRIGVKAYVEKVCRATSQSYSRDVTETPRENGILMARQNGEPRKAEILSIKQRNAALTF